MDGITFTAIFHSNEYETFLHHTLSSPQGMIADAKPASAKIPRII